LDFSNSGLVAYSLAPLSPPPQRAAAVRSYLEGVWAAADTLGLGAGDPFPEIEPARDDWFRVLAQRDSAFLFHKHDTVGIVVRMRGAEREGLPAWKQLYAEWQAAMPAAVDGLLGEAVVFVAQSDAETGDLSSVDAEVAEALPSTETYWPYPTDQSFTLWRAADAEGRRVLAAVAGSGGEEALERWTFWDSERELAGIPRCLIYGAKLRYEFGVYRGAMTRLRDRQQVVDGSLDDLLELHQMMEAGTRVRSDALLDAQSRLSRAETESTGLFITLTRIRELQRTVAIAERNLRRLVPNSPAAAEGDVSPFEDDLELGLWLQEQAANDLAYAEAVRERAREAHALTALRLEQVSAEHARMENQLTLLQTAIVGSLLAGLGAIQTLGATFNLDTKLHIPIVAFVMAIALALPPLIINLFEQYRAFDHAAAAMLGAASAWLLTMIVWRGAPDGSQVAMSVLGSLLFLFGTHELDARMLNVRRRRRLRLRARRGHGEGAG